MDLKRCGFACESERLRCLHVRVRGCSVSHLNSEASHLTASLSERLLELHVRASQSNSLSLSHVNTCESERLFTYRNALCESERLFLPTGMLTATTCWFSKTTFECSDRSIPSGALAHTCIVACALSSKTRPAYSKPAPSPLSEPPCPSGRWCRVVVCPAITCWHTLLKPTPS